MNKMLINTYDFLKSAKYLTHPLPALPETGKTGIAIDSESVLYTAFSCMGSRWKKNEVEN